MNIPKSKYNIADKVLVRCDETGFPFLATVVEIRLNGRTCSANPTLEYTVQDADGMFADGYTEEWLSPENVTSVAPAPELP